VNQICFEAPHTKHMMDTSILPFQWIQTLAPITWSTNQLSLKRFQKLFKCK